MFLKLVCPYIPVRESKGRGRVGEKGGGRREGREAPPPPPPISIPHHAGILKLTRSGVVEVCWRGRGSGTPQPLPPPSPQPPPPPS